MFCAKLVLSTGVGCKRGTATGCSFVLDGYKYELCRKHYNWMMTDAPGLMTDHRNFDPHRRTKVRTIAQAGNESINLRTGQSVEQGVLPMEIGSMITGSTPVTLYGIKSGGFNRTEDGVGHFYWHRSVRVTCENDADLIRQIVFHFQQHQDTKYIVARINASYECFKRSLSHQQMTNCTMAKSRWALG